MSAYRDSLLGQLSPIGSSPYADGQTAPCWVEISHDGRYLFTVNTGSGEHLQLRHQPGRLTRPDRQHAHHAAAGLTSTPGCPRTARRCPVDGSGNHILSVFAVNGGTLTELPSSPAPLPAGGAPAGIVNI